MYELVSKPWELLKSLIMRLLWIFPINKKKIVFSCFSGKRYGDSPKSIAEEIIRQKLDYKLYWLMMPGYETELPPQIKKIPYSFLPMTWHLATAAFWVDSHTKWDYIRKRKGQYYIETGHISIAIKNVEGDAENALSPAYIARVKHNSELADLFISGSKHNSALIRRAYWYNGEIMEYGTPKNDVFFSNKRDIYEKIRIKYGVENKKIALYAPTFRVDENTDCYALDHSMVMDALSRSFGGEWVVFVRLHPTMIKKASLLTVYNDKIINVTAYPDMQELLLATDVLITDYSTCAIDFTIQKRPCFLFALDYDEYMRDRGTAFDYFSLPFPVAQSNDELERNILDFDDNDYKSKLQDFWNQVGFKESGEATVRVVERIKEISGA